MERHLNKPDTIGTAGDGGPPQLCIRKKYNEIKA